MDTLSRYRPIPLRFARLSDEEAQERSAAFYELMRQRRSVRQFSAEPVVFELIERAIATAGTAPSGANQQPWRFVVVQDPELKARIRLAAEREEELLYTERASQEYLEDIEPIGTDWSKPHITDAPYLIVVFEIPYDLEDDGSKRPNYYVRESVGIATGLLLASLHGAGLATLTHSPAPMGFLQDILARPKNERALLLIPVGYPAADAVVPDVPKKGLDEILIRA